MFLNESNEAVEIEVINKKEMEALLANDEQVAKSAELYSYKLSSKSVLKVVNDDLNLEKVIVTASKDARETDPKAYIEMGAKAAKKLKQGVYSLNWEGQASAQKEFAIGWGLSQYQFDQYLSDDKEIYVPELVIGELEEEVQAELESIFLAKDLVNTPPNHMNPEDMEKVIQGMAEEFDAEFSVVRGDQLVKQNFPAIFEVGKGSDIAPRLIELNWGDSSHPKLCVVGKGVCFDAGGYDLKPSSAMRKMKKDMGGAAISIGLARLIMKLNLPVHLKLLVPAVENLVSGNAFKPGDVIDTRKEISVEIDNTDAEGRLVLCDALTYASETDPDLIVNFATLTGACRVALGQDLPGLYSNRFDIAREIQDLSFEVADPVWHMPLYVPYTKRLSSSIADFQNSASGFGGSITAGLYLHQFIDTEKDDWVHLDVYAWSDESNAYASRGAEAQALRAIYQYLKKRYS